MYSDLFSRTGLSLERLHALVLLREKGSLIRAAQGDPVRQSQLSRYLKELSSFFEVDLVVKSGSSLRLTPQGVELVELVERYFGDLSRFREQALGLPRTVVIAADTNLLTSRICPVIGKVNRLAPNCRFQLRNMRAEGILDGLYEQTVSLGLIPKVARTQGLRNKPLFELRYGVFVPDRLVPKSGALTVERAFRDCPHAIDESDEKLQRGVTAMTNTFGIQFKPAMTCSSQIECIAAVRSGFYASILPLSVSIEGCELRIVEDPAFDVLSHQIVVSWNERHCLVNPHVHTVRQALNEFLQDEVRTG
jgi:DNA-binding transcriptional LysR family regulator